MELELIRKYFPLGTTGQIFDQCRLITHSIELPWKDNHAQVSCIPEGRYRIIKRYTEHFGQHFAVMGVTVAGYLSGAGSVLGAVSQITVPGE